MWEESTDLSVDSLHKGPVIWKELPCHDITVMDATHHKRTWSQESHPLNNGCHRSARQLEAIPSLCSGDLVIYFSYLLWYVSTEECQCTFQKLFLQIWHTEIQIQLLHKNGKLLDSHLHEISQITQYCTCLVETVDSPEKGPTMQGFDAFFVVNLNKLLNKQFTCDLRYLNAHVTKLLCISMNIRLVHRYTTKIYYDRLWHIIKLSKCSFDCINIQYKKIRKNI